MSSRRSERIKSTPAVYVQRDSSEGEESDDPDWKRRVGETGEQWHKRLEDEGHFTPTYVKKMEKIGWKCDWGICENKRGDLWFTGKNCYYHTYCRHHQYLVCQMFTGLFLSILLTLRWVSTEEQR